MNTEISKNELVSKLHEFFATCEVCLITNNETTNRGNLTIIKANSYVSTNYGRQIYKVYNNKCLTKIKLEDLERSELFDLYSSPHLSSGDLAKKVSVEPESAFI